MTRGRTTAAAPLRRTGVAAAILALAATAFPGTPQEEIAVRAAAARKSAASSPEQGRRDLLSVLALAPQDTDLWASLAQLDAQDPDRAALWLHGAASAAADVAGLRFRPGKTWPKLPDPDVAAALRVATGRGNLAKQIVASAAKCGPEDVASMLFLERLAPAATETSPLLDKPVAEALAKARARVVPQKKSVLAALEKTMNAALARGDLGTALAAAKCVRGICMQEAQSQSKSGPPLPPDAVRRAVDVIEQVRAAQRKLEQAPRGEQPDGADKPPLVKVWTLDELRAVEPADVPEWDRQHASWGAPGLAVSPQGLYRIETTCGVQTLLAVTEVIDDVHARLVSWYGTDPFEGKPGLVRLCPDDADFEGEGAPFWWAAGFQSGHVTTIIARFPQQSGVAGTLTHELTHRFDQTLLPGMPAWLVEGRATYTATGSLSARAANVDERATGWGHLWEANAKRYGEKANLEKLLKGQPDDYRHNYPAGYSLWLFLSRYMGFDADQKGPRPFAPRVKAYLESFRKDPKGDPVQRFTSFFCDGKDGRPSDLAAFCEPWLRFLQDGASVSRPAPWKATWIGRGTDAQREARDERVPERRIFGRPTWGPERSRHDPVDPGAGQAKRAADILLANGMRAPGIEALRWAALVDDTDRDVWVRLAEAERESGNLPAAWFSRAAAWTLAPSDASRPTGTPGGEAGAAWQSAKDLCDALADESSKAGTAKPLLAFALRADRDRVAEICALPLLGLSAEPAAAGKPPRAPELPPARSLLVGGVEETRWSPLDSQPGAWHQPGPDALVLGTSKQDAARSDVLRDAGVRRTFVLSKENLSGTYTVRTRVRYLSAFASGAFVVGAQGRDRGVEIRFSGGDWMFATGNAAETAGFRHVSVRLSDLSPMSERWSPLQTGVEFDQPRSAFDLEVRVAGPFVTLLVNGKEELSHRVLTGQPVEGRVGFGLESGVIAYEETEVRRHRALGPDRRTAEGAFDAPLSLDRANDFPWNTVVGRRVEGIPASPLGSLLFIYPADSDVARFSEMAIQAEINIHRGMAGDAPVPVAVAVHHAQKEDASEIRDARERLGVAEGMVRTHVGVPGLERALREQVAKTELEEGDAGGGAPSTVTPVWIAVDAAGVVRSAALRGGWWHEMSLFRSLAGQ